jgi:hypothetical protein
MSTNVENTIRIHLQANDAAQETIEWTEIVAHLDADVPLMASPRRSNAHRIWVVVAAAVITVVLVGVLPLLLRNPETPPSDTVVTTTPVDPVASTARVLGPGSWSVVATFPGEPLPPGQLAEMVTQVETWPGVLDVSGVQDQAAWRQFTGIVADCDEGAGFSPCGTGIVVLATIPWAGHTAERLETEYGMEAVTAIDAESAFVEGYIDAALERTSPLALEFDPSGLGAEQTLAGPVAEVDGEVCNRDTCVVVVSTEVDGNVVVAGLSEDLVIDGAGTGFSAHDLMIDSLGRGGALAALNAYTDIDAGIGHRRLYVLAGLPLDAAVVTTDLGGGTRVWQRPVGGMALIVDKVGSISDGFRDYYDQGGAVDPDELDELGRANPLFVLDRAGAQMMRIEDTGHGESVVIDLRIDPDAVSQAIETPFPPTVSAGPVVIPGLGTLTWTESLGVPPGFAQARQPGPLKLRKAQVGDTILMFEDSPLDFDALEKGVEGDNEYRLLASGDDINWTHLATIQAGPRLEIAAGDSFWVYGPEGLGGPNIERFRNSATIWISTDADEWVPVDISFSQWHSIVFVGADAIYIRGAGAGTDTNHYWIGTFER